MASRVARPGWLLALSIVLLLWGLIGGLACFMQVVMGSVPGAAPEDLALIRAMPLWFNLVYCVATLAAILGALALLLRSRQALLWFGISAVAVVVQFGYVFLATDTLARKGAGAAGFPLVIFVVSLFEIWLAIHATRRGWLR